MSDQKPKGKATEMPGVVLRDHVYDGIEEYDQKLPNWWLFTLYIAIVLFVVYWFLYYQLGWFQTDYERLEAKIAVIDAKRDAQLQEMLATLNNDGLWEMTAEPARVDSGKEIFNAKCALCHGTDLSAKGPLGPLPGVPLNDKKWIHGGDPMDVFNVVTNGSPNITSGMIAWKTQMSPADIAKVIAFVMSYHEKGEDWETEASKFVHPGGGAAPAAAPAAPQ